MTLMQTFNKAFSQALPHLTPIAKPSGAQGRNDTCQRVWVLPSSTWSGRGLTPDHPVPERCSLCHDTVKAALLGQTPCPPSPRAHPPLSSHHNLEALGLRAVSVETRT